MKKWNSINKRLKNIIADGLDISFNHCPVVKKTFRDKYPISFFNVKFNGEIIWQYPKDNAYENGKFCDKYVPYNEWQRPWQGGQEKYDGIFWHPQFASPENIIAGYLDLPKSELLNFEEPTGLRYILWACDKRIGKQRLSQMQFPKQALEIVKARVPNYNLEPCYGNSMTLVYTDDDISIFGQSKWKFEVYFEGGYRNIHRFIVADNPSYSLAKHAAGIEFDGKIRVGRFETKIFCKNVLKLTPELEQKILSALKSPSKNMKDKTVWQELITLENLYPTTKEIVPEDKPLFTTIQVTRDRR